MTNGLVIHSSGFTCILQWPARRWARIFARHHDLPTPATQFSDFSPFLPLYGREVRLPVDTVLQPKDHLNHDYKIHLGRILQIWKFAGILLEKNSMLPKKNINISRINGPSCLNTGWLNESSITAQVSLQAKKNVK